VNGGREGRMGGKGKGRRERPQSDFLATLYYSMNNIIIITYFT